MENKERKTRISPLLPSDVVKVECLAEPLQEMFEQMRDAEREFLAAQDRLNSAEGCPADIWKEAFLANFKHERIETQFWHDVRMRYNLWAMGLKIRDGYAIVEPKERPMSIFEMMSGRKPL